MTNTADSDDQNDAAALIVYVFTAPELEGMPPGTLVHEDSETDDRYAARAEALRFYLEKIKRHPARTQ